MRKTCRTCHFLTKRSTTPGFQNRPITVHKVPWSEADRDAGTVRDRHSAECWHGIWDRREDPSLVLKETLSVGRGKCPFFFRYQPGMLFEGANSLLEEAKSRQRDRREWIQIVIAFVAGAAGVSAVWLTYGQ